MNHIFMIALILVSISIISIGGVNAQSNTYVPYDSGPYDDGPYDEYNPNTGEIYYANPKAKDSYTPAPSPVPQQRTASSNSSGNKIEDACIRKVRSRIGSSFANAQFSTGREVNSMGGGMYMYIGEYRSPTSYGKTMVSTFTCTARVEGDRVLTSVGFGGLRGLLR